MEYRLMVPGTTYKLYEYSFYPPFIGTSTRYRSPDGPGSLVDVVAGSAALTTRTVAIVCFVAGAGTWSRAMYFSKW